MGRQMTSSWKRLKLKDIGQIVTGKTPPTKHPEYFGDYLPFVTPTDFDGRRRIDKTKRYLSKGGAKILRSSIVPPESVMVSCIGSDLGKVAIAGKECVTNQQSNTIIVAPGNDPLFVYYSLSIRQQEFKIAASGSAQPIINKTEFGNFDILLPPLPEQRAIAHILGTLDDKIELLRRMSETLEEMARALFKAWFVDFVPVRAKMEGRWKRGQSLPGLPAHLYDLFPDRLVPSELGEIPEGWEVQRFADIVARVRESVNPFETPEFIFKHFSIPAFDSGQWPYAEVGADIKSQKWVVPPGAILLSKLNPEVERVWLVDVQPDENAVCSTEFMVLKPQYPYGRTYIYSLIRSPAFRETLKSLVTGTSKSHQRVRETDIWNILVLRAQKAPVSAFEQVSSPFLKRTLQSRRESRTLAALRDTLLPKLVSGDIREKDAERFLKERE